MKKRIGHILIPILLVTGMACTRNTTEIVGTVVGGSDQTLTLERLDVNRTTVIDSVQTDKTGTFRFRIKQEEPALYILKHEKGEILNLLLSPGEHISVSTTAESFGEGYEVEGSEESEKIRMLVKHLTRTRNDLDSLLSLVDSLDNPEDPQINLIKHAYTQAIIKQKRYTIRFLVENMTSLSSVYALYQKYDNENLILSDQSDLQYYKTVADSLELVYPDNPLTKSLRADIISREEEINTAIQVDRLLSLAEAESAGLLELSIPDRNRKEVILSSLKGQVVLVAFWASGNQSSIQSLLRLKSTYDRYHDKGFEVYAISMDNNKIQWMQAIDYNEFNWINVSELTYPDSRAGTLYNVTELPTTYLINRQGDIVSKNLYGRTLETWLDNLI